ncbi:MAG: cytochrome c oxidase subunit II [Rhodoferax sp.]|nr:cytochrome c oxidase subunit II [Rhodoferax sp.]
MQHFYKLGLALWMTLMSVAVQAGYAYNLPEPVTPIARETLHMHNLVMVVILIMFFGVLAMLIYSFYTHRKAAGFKAATFTGPTNRKQWLWALFPFALLFVIDYGVFGIPAYHAVVLYEDTKTDAELVVKVTGSQWMWQYDFPAEGVSFTSRLITPREQIDSGAVKGEHYLLEVDNPLVLPVGKKVRFITTSNDVIHSWWVPAFGVKRDAVPGFLREFWATVEKTGTYRGQCSELCGKEHGFMPVVVNVVSQEEFATWLASKKPVATAAAAAPAVPASATAETAPGVTDKVAVVAKAAQ